ncbi:MAG TPA: hydroxysqualene dehydroxylase HpnE [Pseudolabrys sp.]|nr:hydroxysqualene dehydroxylase HpnE [Pseudolabrys sp.]
MVTSVHIVGAGMAGLAAATRLSAAGVDVTLHEAANQAGGRCRSYHDQTIDMLIDNGNHLVLSGNGSVLAYLADVGATDRLVGPAHAEFPFVDLATNERWTLRPNDGVLPWWIFDSSRRVPGTRAANYLAMARLLWHGKHKTIGETIDCNGTLYRRLMRPVLLAALNTEPREGSAALAAAVIRETLATGGRACRPLVARDGLGLAFVEPALQLLARRNAKVQFGHRLRAFNGESNRVTALQFGDETIALGPNDAVILAVPPMVASAIVPGLQTPDEFRAIVNAHFRIEPPKGLAPITGSVNSMVEWLFAFPDRLSVTISAADRLLDTSREELAEQIWREVCAIARIDSALPRWQIVRERRATFAATPAQDAKRPKPETAYRNLWLAGDWTATGLPATIESAIRSGHKAAQLAGDSTAH